jgi:hypothetical protein
MRLARSLTIYYSIVRFISDYFFVPAGNLGEIDERVVINRNQQSINITPPKKTNTQELQAAR